MSGMFINASSFNQPIGGWRVDKVTNVKEMFRGASAFNCPVPLTVRGTQVLVGFAPLAPSVFCAARQNAVLRRSYFRHV